MDETLELTAEAQRLGASAALVVAPYYARPQQAGLVRVVLARRDRVPRPADHRLQRPDPLGRGHRAADRRRLRRAHENIVGIKETTRDFEHVSYVLHECGSDFIALSGIELLLLPDARARRPRPPELRRELRPEPVAELYDAFVAGDHERARELHYELHALVDAAFVEVNPVPPSGSCASSGSCRVPSRASRSHRSARPPRRRSARCCRRPTPSRSASRSRRMSREMPRVSRPAPPWVSWCGDGASAGWRVPAARSLHRHGRGSRQAERSGRSGRGRPSRA